MRLCFGIFAVRLGVTYYVDLPNRVEQHDGEDGDGQAKGEALGQVPEDPLEPDGQQQHQDRADPDEGGQEEQQQDQRSRQGGNLKRKISLTVPQTSLLTAARFKLTCNPALKINRSKLQPMAVVKPRSKS